MKKIFTKRLLIYMLIAFVVTIVAVIMLQIITNRHSYIVSSQNKLIDVEEKLADNERAIAKLTKSLSENNLAKARAFADMLAADISIENSPAKLSEITERLMVNEVHIIDEVGIITSSTFDYYVGYDMKSAEQSRAFMVLVDDPSIEIVQEPQINGAAGIMMQYIGVARRDKRGFVQVGVRPEVLEETLADTDISVVLKSIDFGKNGYIYAIDKESKQILAHPNNELIGTLAVDAGFLEDFIGYGRAVIDGKNGYFYAKENDNMIIGTFLPSSEHYESLRNQTLILSLSILLIFIALLLMINHMVDHQIIQRFNRIILSMKKIAHGDFNVVVNEKGMAEFEQLSDSINKMLESIYKGIEENKSLMKHQEIGMKNVKNACKELSQVSKEILEYADNIYNGSEKQEHSVSDLKQIMENLIQELNQSISTSVDISTTTGITTERIREAQSQMTMLESSMKKIADMSVKIEKIVDEINYIAQQTRILSLNASIESAKAEGTQSKGFGVIATQVGELAARTLNAAKETNDLITNSMQAIREGQTITQQTVDTFSILVENIEQAKHEVGKISQIVEQSMDTVKLAANQLGQISDVVEKYVNISYNTKKVSSDMASITDNLLKLIEN